MSTSLRNALKVTKQHSADGEQYLYTARVSEAWSNGGIPQGGYVVGLIVSAVGDLQSGSLHPDPVHLTAHFLQPVDVAECEIRITVVRRGKNFSNIDADLVQNGTTKISTRLIFGALLDLTQLSPSQASDNLTLTATSPYGRQIPLSKHPAQETLDKPSGKCTFQYKAEDRIFEERNRRRAERKSTAFNDSGLSETPDCGLEWGTWLELQDPDDVLEIAMIPFFSDCMKNLPSLLPQELRPGPTWFATMVLTIEFKSRIPIFDSDPQSKRALFSSRTIGLYASSRFLTEGRHDEFVEVWTSPSRIGSGSGSGEDVDPRWREKQVCLAVSTQMALTIPEEKSRRSKSRL